MKILWFVNDEFPDVSSYFGRPFIGGSGWWMKMLSHELSKNKTIELVIVCEGRSYARIEKLLLNSITYYCIPRSLLSTLCNATGKQITHCKDIVFFEKPDIVHVFGSENYWGLLVQYCTCPVVLRIQGVLNELIRCFRAQIPFCFFVRYPYLLLYWYLFRIRLKRERQILKSVHFFEGQSNWDQGIVKTFNPNAHYYRNAPLLRSPFLRTQWDLNTCKKYSIAVISSFMPYKGLHILLTALKSIKIAFPQISLRLIGHMDFKKSYGAYCYRLICRYGIKENVELIKSLDADGLAVELQNAHVFVVPSFNENESNSLLEAMSVGTPCVASSVGGIPTMAQDGVTARLVPPGDPEMLAAAIGDIFKDSLLAQQLSQNARTLSLQRHNPQTIVQKTMQMYEDILCRTSPAGQK